MSAWNHRQDKRAIVDEVLPDVPKLSEAPACLEDLPGYSVDFSVDETQKFRQQAMPVERQRKYKWADASGNVYLTTNPWLHRLETREDGTHWVIRPKPQLVMRYEEARRKAEELARRGSTSHTNGTAQHSDDTENPQVNFDY